MPPYESINLHPDTHSASALSTTTFDVICLGSGWAGRIIAARVIKAGLTAVIVENELVGGDCPFWACIPSKVLLRPQEALDELRGVHGVRERVDASTTLDVEAIFKQRDIFTSGWDDGKVVVPIVEGFHAHLVRGTGKLDGNKKVLVEAVDGTTTSLTANHAVVVSTGSYAIIPDVPGLVDVNPWTPRHATSASKAPGHLVVLGGGAVGCEMVTAYVSFGSKVTVISSTPEILAKLEPEAGQLVREALTAKGVKFHTSTSIKNISRDGAGKLSLMLSDGETIEADEILVAAGRRPNTAGIGLEQFGVAGDGQPIPVDRSLRVKSVPDGWLYAAGDTNARHPLTHGSKYHGRVVADAILAKVKGVSSDDKWARSSAIGDELAVPQVVFTNPVVAAVGLTKEAAEKAGMSIKTVNAKVMTHGAHIRDLNADQGWAQWVVETKTNKLIGATFVGKGVTELVHASTVAIVGEMTLDRLAHAVPPFPTMSEVYLNLLEAAGY